MMRILDDDLAMTLQNGQKLRCINIKHLKPDGPLILGQLYTFKRREPGGQIFLEFEELSGGYLPIRFMLVNDDCEYEEIIEAQEIMEALETHRYYLPT